MKNRPIKPSILAAFVLAGSIAGCENTAEPHVHEPDEVDEPVSTALQNAEPPRPATPLELAALEAVGLAADLEPEASVVRKAGLPVLVVEMVAVEARPEIRTVPSYRILLHMDPSATAALDIERARGEAVDGPIRKEQQTDVGGEVDRTVAGCMRRRSHRLRSRGDFRRLRISCVKITNPAAQPRYLGSHRGDEWIRVYVYKNGVSEMAFDLKGFFDNVDVRVN